MMIYILYSVMCEKAKENEEAIHYLIKKLDKCLNQKIFSTYPAIVETQKFGMKNKDYSGVAFNLRFSEKVKTTVEEIYIIDGIDLLSSVGGALGLFIGFSFFDYIGAFVDAALDTGAARFFQR